MDKNTVIDKVKQYSDLVRTYFPVQKIILFGSYAKGTAGEYSDIDVAVVVDKIDGDLLESKAKLFNLTHDIDVSIEPILFESDTADPSGFFAEIQKTGEVIYSI
jgi:predicted nucleotidyltransferase